METGLGFADERQMIERALADLDAGDEPVFPPVALRFLRAREAAGLTQNEVAAQWGQQPSMYWDLELYDSEAFDVISVQDLVTLAAILHVSVMELLFGQEPSPGLLTIPYSEIARRLRSEVAACASVEKLSEQVGWDVKEYIEHPDKLAELPISGLRSVCQAVHVDWATTLANPTARPTA